MNANAVLAKLPSNSRVTETGPEVGFNDTDTWLFVPLAATVIGVVPEVKVAEPLPEGVSTGQLRCEGEALIGQIIYHQGDGLCCGNLNEPSEENSGQSDDKSVSKNHCIHKMIWGTI